MAGDPTKVGDGAGGMPAVAVGATAVGAHPIVVRVEVSSMTWVRFLVTYIEETEYTMLVESTGAAVVIAVCVTV